MITHHIRNNCKVQFSTIALTISLLLSTSFSSKSQSISGEFILKTNGMLETIEFINEWEFTKTSRDESHIYAIEKGYFLIKEDSLILFYEPSAGLRSSYTTNQECGENNGFTFSSAAPWFDLVIYDDSNNIVLSKTVRGSPFNIDMAKLPGETLKARTEGYQLFEIAVDSLNSLSNRCIEIIFKPEQKNQLATPVIKKYLISKSAKGIESFGNGKNERYTRIYNGGNK